MTAQLRTVPNPPPQARRVGRLPLRLTLAGASLVALILIVTLSLGAYPASAYDDDYPAPEDLSAEAGHDHVTITWVDPDTPTAIWVYTYYYVKDPVGDDLFEQDLTQINGRTYASSQVANSITIDNLEPAANYGIWFRYACVANNEQGQIVSPYAFTRVTTTSTSEPTVQSAEWADQQVTITLAPHPDQTVTRYESSANGGQDWTSVPETDNDTTILTVTGLTNGVLTTVQIRAVTPNGFGTETSYQGYPLPWLQVDETQTWSWGIPGSPPTLLDMIWENPQLSVIDGYQIRLDDDEEWFDVPYSVLDSGHFSLPPAGIGGLYSNYDSDPGRVHTFGLRPVVGDQPGPASYSRGTIAQLSNFTLTSDEHSIRMTGNFTCWVPGTLCEYSLQTGDDPYVWAPMPTDEDGNFDITISNLQSDTKYWITPRASSGSLVNQMVAGTILTKPTPGFLKDVTINASVTVLKPGETVALTADVVKGGDEDVSFYCQYQAKSENDDTWWDSGYIKGDCKREVSKDSSASYDFRLVLKDLSGNVLMISNVVKVTWQYPDDGGTIHASPKSANLGESVVLYVDTAPEHGDDYTCQFQAQVGSDPTWWDSGEENSDCARTITKDYPVNYTFQVLIKKPDGTIYESANTVEVSWHE